MWDAFWVCNTSRAVYDGSIGSIPLTAYAAYLEIFEICDSETRQLFVRTMMALDSVYKVKVNAQIKRTVDRDRDAEQRRLDRG
jgi:hypothetical protein